MQRNDHNKKSLGGFRISCTDHREPIFPYLVLIPGSWQTKRPTCCGTRIRPKLRIRCPQICNLRLRVLVQKRHTIPLEFRRPTGNRRRGSNSDRNPNQIGISVERKALQKVRGFTPIPFQNTPQCHRDNTLARQRPEPSQQNRS